MAHTSNVDIANFENIMSLDAPIESSVVPRWKRKQLQQQQQGSTASSENDRYIPNRATMNMDMANYALSKENSDPNCPEEQGRNDMLKQNLLSAGDDSDKAHRILSLKHKAPAPKEGHQNSLKILYSQNQGCATYAKSKRHIPSAPSRILDAPDVVDDYYLNLLSWSKSNVLAVALNQSVYLWEAATGSITELMSVTDSDDYISSVSWIQEGGSHLAIGTANAKTQLWDCTASRQVRSMNGHAARVGSLAWNRHILSSGSRDSTIVHHDVRAQQHVVATLEGHQQEVCGLAWSHDGKTLASGGNDNQLCLWDASISDSKFSLTPRATLTDHMAAVKALAWCPFERNVLASGGGTADRCIKFWNAGNGQLLNSIDTGSQVCALQWSPHEKELLSSHGYSENQLCLWKYPSMVKVKEFTGHTSRVLHMAQSPDGSTVVSAAADETLRFWNIFGSAAASKKSAPADAVSHPMHVR